jgi:XTP/dITP diphosphohydrolase
LIYRGKLYTFTGVCDGKITNSRKGSGGFGYDSIFLPTGEQKTFAQMDSFEKNKISHRNNALIKMGEFFNNLKISEK